MVRGIFVSHRKFLEGSKGGVQVCTQEYLEVIREAGIDLTLIAFDGDQRLITRILRRINSSPYFRPFEVDLLQTLRAKAERHPPDFVFLNQVTLAPMASEIRAVMPGDCKIVVLSHGLESTDFLHILRLRRRLPLSGRARPSSDIALGKMMLAEAASRAHVDIVCALSDFDVELEHWIGARRVGWLPRIVLPHPINLRPTGHRLGFVGTLDHAPNLEGLVAILDILPQRSDGETRIRVVGGPSRIGSWLENTYACVDYMGSLGADELVQEAATWTAFLHPIFCHPRGCSTKLATAISWQIPIVTTPMGRRGYEWRDGSLIEARNPNEFVKRCFELSDRTVFEAARQEVVRVAASSPRLSEVANELKWLLGISQTQSRPLSQEKRKRRPGQHQSGQGCGCVGSSSEKTF